jgi:hypothetical protein
MKPQATAPGTTPVPVPGPIPIDPGTDVAPCPSAPTPFPSPARLAAACRLNPWSGTAILFRHYPDGSVAATARGKVGLGHSENEALADLVRTFKRAQCAAAAQ